MTKGQQELILIRQVLVQIEISNKNKSKGIEESNNSQIKDIQSVMDNMKIKGNQLRDQLEEAKSWTHVVRGPLDTQRDLVEK